MHGRGPAGRAAARKAAFGHSQAISFPTGAKLLQRTGDRLVSLAPKHSVRLRQSYVRVGNCGPIRHQRYADAKQFMRANRAPRTLRIYFVRVSHDIGRRIAGLKEIFVPSLSLAAGCTSSASASAATRG